MEDFVSELNPTVYHSRGRVYLEYSQEINVMVWYKLWIEYLPNFTVSEDYMCTHRELYGRLHGIFV